MVQLTNELLMGLQQGLAMANEASDTATAAGVPMSPNTPFFRMGEPFRLPVSPTSGVNRFPSATTDLVIPPHVTTFRVTNNNPFCVRMRGQQPDAPFVAVTATTGWLFLPGTTEVLGSKYPIALTVMSVDGPLAASDDTQKAGTGFLEMQYGTGG